MKSLLLFLVLVAGGLFGFLYWQQTKYPSKVELPTVEKIIRGKVEDKITGSGKVEPKGGLRTVSVEDNGKIVSGTKNLTVGKSVKDGEILLKLDDALQQNQVSLAEASLTAANGKLKSAQAGKLAATAKVNSIQYELEYARTQLRSAEKMLENSVGSDSRLKEARAALDAKTAAADAAKAYELEADANIEAAKSDVQRAQAGVTLAKRGLEQTQIKAPTAGIVLEINPIVQDGQIVPKGAPLIKIAPFPDQWEVKAQISEQDIGRLQNKMAQAPVLAHFSTEAYSAERDIKPFSGKVTSIAPVPTTAQRSGFGGLEALQLGALGAAPSTGPSTYTVTISVDPLDENVRKTHPLNVGFTATDIQLVLNEFNNVILVPSLALSFKPDGLSDSQQVEINRHENDGWSVIWLWNNGQYEPKYIKAGASELGHTHVREVMNGKPEELLDKSAVIEGPKRAEKGGLFGGGQSFKIPG